MTIKIVGCVLFGHRFATVEEATDGTKVVACRWCGRRETLPPGASIVQWGGSWWPSRDRGGMGGPDGPA